jgi:hypothetical protein
VTTSQKAALSLLISVVLVAGFSVLAFTGFFNLVETQFYNPSITNSLNKEVRRDADTIENYFGEMEQKFSATLKDDAIKRSFLPNQSAEDIFFFSRLYGMLMESENGLQSVRFIDAGGLRIHFATSSADILSQTNDFISYKNYDETPFVPYGELAVHQGEASKITLDQQNERIIFSFPFVDALDLYRGTAIFSLSTRALVDQLIMEGRLKVGEDISIVSVPPGIVSGLPNTAKEAILSVISMIWQEGLYRLTNLHSGDSSGGSSAVLVSAKTSRFTVGRVVGESLFDFPQIMKVILLLAVFLTIFLTIFLLFNLRPDMMTVVQNRLKRLQLSLIRDYYDRKGEMDWNLWRHELEQRREDVRAELRRGIKNKPASMLEDIDILIDKSWDEILGAIGGRRETRLAIDEDKLQTILSRMLMTAGNIPAIQAMSGTVGGSVPAGRLLAEKAPAEELSEDAEELEELDDLEELSGEDELEELPGDDDEPEELAEAEELVEIEEITEVEELGEPEELIEVEELFFPSFGSEQSSMASEIEFSSSKNEENSLPDIGAEVEIVSPFSGIFSPLEENNNFPASDDEVVETKTSGRLEELSTDYSMSLVYKPFQNEDIGELQELPPAGIGVIKQKNGIHYVAKTARIPNAETTKTLDPGLKSLVDSVIGKK